MNLGLIHKEGPALESEESWTMEINELKTNFHLVVKKISESGTIIVLLRMDLSAWRAKVSFYLGKLKYSQNIYSFYSLIE